MTKMTVLGRGSSHVSSLFDIRLNTNRDDLIIIRGRPGDNNYWLRGTVVLSLIEPIPIKAIRLRFYGKLKLSWCEMILTSSRATSQRPQRLENIVYEKTWSFLPPGHSKTFGIGNYEYPFEVCLPADIPESVQSNFGANITYRIKAVVERPIFSMNITKERVINIVRTIPLDSIELEQTVSVQNIWPLKIEYDIGVPSKAFAIGSTIPIRIVLVPLLKNLAISKIHCVLREFISFHIENGYHGIPANHEAIRSVKTLDIEDIETDVDSWEINRTMQLPRLRTECTQDVDLPNIKIRHKLKFTISILNPDGHISELRAALPIMLVMSPSLFDNGSTDSLEEMNREPQLPSYEDRVFDRLWDGVTYEDALIPQINEPTSDSGTVNASEDNVQDRSAERPRFFNPSDLNDDGYNDSDISGSYNSAVEDTVLRTSDVSLHRNDAGSQMSLSQMREATQPIDIQPLRPNSRSARLHSPMHPNNRISSCDNMEELNRVPSYQYAANAHSLSMISLSHGLPSYEDVSRLTEEGAETAARNSEPAQREVTLGHHSQSLTDILPLRPPVLRLSSERPFESRRRFHY